MSALLTGGSGFLGRWLRPLLPDPVCAPSSAELNLCDPASIERVLRDCRPQLVFHLAALTDVRADAAQLQRVNAAGTVHLLQALARYAPRARLLVVSSCHVVGRPRYLPMDEEHPLEPRSAYAVSKADAERAVRAARPDAIIVRPFNLLGPGQPPQHAVSEWLARVRDGATELRVGDLSLRRDYLDVRDCAEGLALLMQRAAAGSTLNLCSGRAVAMRRLAELAAPGLPLRLDPARLRPGEAPILLGDNRRARALGWEPTRPLQVSVNALRESIAGQRGV